MAKGEDSITRVLDIFVAIAQMWIDGRSEKKMEIIKDGKIEGAP